MKDRVLLHGGLLQGERLRDGRTVRFLGIPYAAPPVGDLRWRRPQPPRPWSGVRDATRPGPISIQRDRAANSLFPIDDEPQSEDCLYLNVWTAARSGGERRPVIVWLHPGGFQFGSGSTSLYEGKAWARAGAVFVTINFRLSRLGFLAHPALVAADDDGATGNYGLFDQIAALRWVRDNISEFGGDPGCVTLYGISSGATSASLLMGSPLAAGLFHRVIAESGGSFGPVGDHTGIGDHWQTSSAACETGARWAHGLGADTAEQLRALPARLIRSGSVAARNERRNVFDAARPVIGGPVLPVGTRTVFCAHRQAAVPIMVGSAANEGLGTLSSAGDLASFSEQAGNDHGKDASRFLELYPAATDEEAIAASLRANGHRLFTWQSWIWARLQARSGHPAYYYRFEQAPPVPPARYTQQRIARPLGAFHAASIFYAFDGFWSRADWPWSDADRRVGHTMTATWVEFARTGRPAHGDLPIWPTFDPAAQQLMHITSEASLGPIPARQNLDFWDTFYGTRNLEFTTTSENE